MDGWCRATVLFTLANYGFGASFESLVAEIVAKFLTSFEASRERCWIADIDGAPVGSVFLVKHTEDIAKLRLLLVDPAGRGQDWGSGWSVNASPSRGPPAIARSRSGPRAFSSPRARFIGRPDSCRSPPSRIAASAPDLIGETWELEL